MKDGQVIDLPTHVCLAIFISIPLPLIQATAHPKLRGISAITP
jgi:hypothetical protein